MLSFYHRHLIFLLLTIKLILAEEITTQSVLVNLPEMVHEKTYHEMHTHLLPKIRRICRKLQSMIVKTAEEFNKMQDYKDFLNQSCQSSSLIFNMTELLKNLTQIIQKDVPLIEEALNRIVPQMDELQKQIDGLMDYVKKQQMSRWNTEQLEKLQTLTNNYQKLNDQLHQINRQLMQMMDEILSPGLDSFEKYNACLNSTAHSLIDYGLDQLVEHMDDDDDQLFPSEELSLSNNHTDL